MPIAPSVALGHALLAALAVGLAYRLALGMMPRTSVWARTAAVAVAMLLGARYVWWRWTWTLPDLAFTFEALWPWLFGIAEGLVIASAFVSMLTMTRHADRTPEADAGQTRLERRRQLPRVDVFIPTYNEDREILEKTIVGAKALNWPDFEVFVLDDGNRPWLADLCREKGVRYVTRPEHTHAKAGNMNHALQLSTAPYIMVLDADFVPRRRFLRRVMGFFDDPAVGIVQTPQHFYNADPVQHNLLASRSWADEQRFFFDTLQPAKDAWDCAFCCGTSSVVRRAALDAVGGFPTETITEDIHLTYKLFDHGYITRYLAENLSMGLAAEGIGEYLSQRARWCIGTLQQLFLRSGPLGVNGQTLMQRLQYLSGVFHWLLFPHRILFMLAPPVFWFTDVPALVTELGPLMYYFLPAFLANWMLITWLSRNTIFPLFWDVSQFLASFVIVRASLAALTRPSGHKFKVTAKGGDRSRIVVHWTIVWKAGLLIAVTAAGVALNTLPETTLVSLDGRAVNIAWSLVNVITLGFVIMAAIDLPRRRTEERFHLEEPATLAAADGSPRAVTITDMSLTGVALRGAEVPPHAALDVEEVGTLTLRPVRTDDGVTSCRFEGLTPDQRDALIVKLFASKYQNTVGDVAGHHLVRTALRRAFGHVEVETQPGPPP